MRTKEQLLEIILQNSKQKILDLENKIINIQSYIDKLKQQIFEIEQNNYKFPKNICAFANNFLKTIHYECDICLEVFNWGHQYWFFNVNNDWQNTKICSECTEILAYELFEFCKLFNHYYQFEDKYEKIIGELPGDLSHKKATEFLEKIKELNASSR